MREKIFVNQRSRASIIMLVAFAACLFGLSAQNVSAAILTVTNTNDSGAGSLRQAIADAASGDTVNFNLSGCPCTITLTSGELIINKSLTIQGLGADRLAISGNSSTRVLLIFSAGTVRLEGFTITGGNGESVGDPTNFSSGLGGGIYIWDTTVTITNTAVSGNYALSGGGGIYNNFSTTTIANSSISGNSATSFSYAAGGGIINIGNLTVIDSTVSGNFATEKAGGIYSTNSPNTLTLINCTITGNIADSDGNSNGFAGGIWANSNEVLTNTIIAGNLNGTGFTPDDIGGTVETANHDLVGDAATSGEIVNGVNGNKVGVHGSGTLDITKVLDTKLAFNGGPTKTHALVSGSPAIDAGISSGQTFDQRGSGFARIFDDPSRANSTGGDGADIGSFEAQRPICFSCSFAPASNIVLGSVPRSVTTADFNGDGNLDLTVANPVGNSISVLLGDGSGGFGPATNFAVGTGPLFVMTEDFNGDGKLDVVTANSPSASVSVLLGDGSGGFGAATNFNTGGAAGSVTTGDFNSDGKLDLAVTNGFTTVSLLLGDGSGNFGPPTNFTVGKEPLSVTQGDFNGDGNLDLAVANSLSNTVSVLLGNGSGGFSAATNFGVGINPGSVITGDFNRDGKLDLATSNLGTNNVSVLLGNGSGGFATSMNFAVGNAPVSITKGDFNGDGKLDLAAANVNPNTVSVLLGNGLGGFGPATSFGVGTSPFSVSSGDFNGDGKPDLATANELSSNVSVLLNNCTSNTAPTATDDSYTTNEDTALSALAPGLLGNDTDNEGDSLTAFLVSGPSHAQSFTLNADGSFSYTPAANYNGSDSFTYEANDGSLDSNTATVRITVNAVNDPPTVMVVRGGSCSGTSVSGTMNLLLADVDSPISSLTIGGNSSNTSLVANTGIVFGGSGASRTVTITVQPKRTGTAVVTMNVSDGQAAGSVAITVIVGSDKNETLNGTSGADMIFGLGGKNTINGNAGNDLLCGGNGVDIISGGDGDDTIDGGNGDDVISGGTGNDVLIGGAGNDQLFGGDGDDTLTGGTGADFFSGGSGTNDVATDFTPSQGDTKDGTIP